MPKLERELEKECVDIAEANGCMALKMDKVKRGWPDQIIFRPAPLTVLIVEFKRPGQHTRPKQDDCFEGLEKLGYIVHVVDSVEQFTTLLASI